MAQAQAQNLSKSFHVKPNVAQFAAASWDLEIDRLPGITLEQAQAHALSNDSITYFFRIKDGATMVLTGRGVFNSGDTVFFAGVPWYGSANGFADSYEKIGGNLETDVPSGCGFTYLQASMIVPDYITPQGTLFLWPGLQPGGQNYNPICNGVLQPVLTYGNSCAPNPGNISSAQWWISGQYVNTDTAPGIPAPFQGCHGGNRMALKAKDSVTVTMQYDAGSQNWLQTCAVNGTTVDYTIALSVNGNAQEQNRCLFYNELPGGSSMSAAFSLFNITVRTHAPYNQLAQNLLSLPQVTGVNVNSNNMEFTIDRVVIYTPIG